MRSRPGSLSWRHGRERQRHGREIRPRLEAKINQLEQEQMQVKARFVRDCVEARRYNRSGVVTIYPDNFTPLQVFCDQDTDGGGWLVFQRRQDGSVDFYRNWASYQKGFGDVSKEFWLGLDALHMLTSNRSCVLRVDMMAFNGERVFAKYKNFYIGNSSSNYILRFTLLYFHGSTSNSLYYHEGAQFTTHDADNDKNRKNCAIMYRSAWWYKSCYHSQLNGNYKQASNKDKDGVVWQKFDDSKSLKFAEMKLRAV